MLHQQAAGLCADQTWLLQHSSRISPAYWTASGQHGQVVAEGQQNKQHLARIHMLPELPGLQTARDKYRQSVGHTQAKSLKVMLKKASAGTPEDPCMAMTNDQHEKPCLHQQLCQGLH